MTSSREDDAQQAVAASSIEALNYAPRTAARGSRLWSIAFWIACIHEALLAFRLAVRWVFPIEADRFGPINPGLSPGTRFADLWDHYDVDLFALAASGLLGLAGARLLSTNKPGGRRLVFLYIPCVILVTTVSGWARYVLACGPPLTFRGAGVRVYSEMRLPLGLDDVLGGLAGAIPCMVFVVALLVERLAGHSRER